MRMCDPGHGGGRGQAAVTLLELLVTIAIISLILALAYASYEQFLERARKARCIGNLRALYAALSHHVEDRGMWPQMDPEKSYDDEAFFEFWITATEPYGVDQETWVCPSDRQLERRLNEGNIRYFGSYVPTQFDHFPSTPFRWSQPWALERGLFHGRSSHMLMPDGSVQETSNPFYGR